jgi:hypothetical protein
MRISTGELSGRGRNVTSMSPCRRPLSIHYDNMFIRLSRLGESRRTGRPSFSSSSPFQPEAPVTIPDKTLPPRHKTTRHATGKQFRLSGNGKTPNTSQTKSNASGTTSPVQLSLLYLSHCPNKSVWYKEKISFIS